MKFDAQTRICDQCKKEVTQRTGMAGGWPFGGWLHVTQVGEGIISRSPDMDFCSLECLVTWAGAHSRPTEGSGHENQRR